MWPGGPWVSRLALRAPVREISEVSLITRGCCLRWSWTGPGEEGVPHPTPWLTGGGGREPGPGFTPLGSWPPRTREGQGVEDGRDPAAWCSGLVSNGPALP